MNKKYSKRKVNKYRYKQRSNNYLKFGKMPIKRVKFGDRHPHVIICEGDFENISVGLTTSNNRKDLKRVYYSNGKTAYMKRTASRENVSQYESKTEKYHLDLESENRAYKIAINKLLKDIGKDKKRNKKN